MKRDIGILAGFFILLSALGWAGSITTFPITTGQTSSTMKAMRTQDAAGMRTTLGAQASISNQTCPTGKSVYQFATGVFACRSTSSNAQPHSTALDQITAATWTGAASITTVGTLASGAVPWSLITNPPIGDGTDGNYGCSLKCNASTFAVFDGYSSGYNCVAGAPYFKYGSTNFALLYTLPTASASVKGGIKVGSGLTIDGSGILSTTGGGGAGSGITVNAPFSGAQTIRANNHYDTNGNAELTFRNFTTSGEMRIKTAFSGYSSHAYGKYSFGNYTGNYGFKIPANTFAMLSCHGSGWQVDWASQTLTKMNPPAGGTVPTLSTAVLGTDGVSYTYTYNQAVQGGSTAALCNAYSLSWTTAGAITQSYSSGTGTTSVICTGTPTVNSGDTKSAGLNYTPGTIVASSGGQALASISGKAVTNNSTQTGSYTLTDDFGRSENPLSNGGKWTSITASAFWTNTNGTLICNPSGGDFCGAYRNDWLGGSDQCSQLTVLTNYTGVSVRSHGYTASGGSVSIGGTLWGTYTAEVAGDTLKICAKGTTITVYKNGSSVFGGTNSASSSGYPGIWVFGTPYVPSVSDDYIAVVAP